MPDPTPPQLAFLRHLVTSGRPWRAEPPRPVLPLAGRPRVRPLRGESRSRIPPDWIYRLPSGLAVRVTTVRRVVELGWLLAIGMLSKPGALAVITPAGRLVLQLHQPDLPSGWDDEDLIRLREPGPGICRGPIEVEACGEPGHEHELEAYRWTWARPSDPSIIANHLQYLEAGEPEPVQACRLCRAEAEQRRAG